MSRGPYCSKKGECQAGTFLRKQGMILLFALCLSWVPAEVRSECANACNGHGKCTSYDMCICYRNWQAGDCSERK